MSIKFKCKCGRLLQADDQYAGTKIPCWSCGQNVLVPRASEDGPKKSGPAPVAKWSADLPPEGIIEPGGETIKFACPCGKHIRAGVAQIGKRVGCPRCRKAVVVPSGQKKPKPEVAQDAGERKPGLGDLALDSSLDIEFESEEDAKATKVIP
ncbi:MAG: hypothetical protein FJ278_07895, partial [Planctomycetes bacterium]|nr:hypothetical protein [Planctomycetota bacterium]